MIVSVDLSSFSRWANIEAGEHSVTVKARGGNGYTASDASVAVTVTKS